MKTPKVHVHALHFGKSNFGQKHISPLKMALTNRRQTKARTALDMSNDPAKLDKADQIGNEEDYLNPEVKDE
jgi:hypothetical protein